MLDHTPILNGNRPLPWLQVGVPCKRVMDTVTVKCGHCSHLSFLSPRAMVQSLTPTDHRMGLQWAKCDPRCSTTISTSDNSSGKSYHSYDHLPVESGLLLD
ncbi:hypothetical protein B296_00053920 [Ensete ventricosum]|uniref:YABBY N-terminal domain-containing protein n=1 Tax=Ensete ventricosum TaxID=4639 RepID=A0A426XF45_ENSVE|nr:hypothetical protein B296_00053920 [Ensete ventricosum]